MAINLTTLAEIRAFTGITSTQINDADLERIAEAVEAFIARKCNRVDGFITATHTELVNGRNQDRIYVRYSPITSITSIKTVDTASLKTTIDSSLYTFETTYSGKIAAIHGNINSHIGRFESGQPLRGGLCPRRLFPDGRDRKNIEVIYAGGYANTASVPEDLSQAVIETTGLWASRRKRDLALQSESLGNYSYSLASRMEIDPDTGLPEPISVMIRPYIRKMVA